MTPTIPPGPKRITSTVLRRLVATGPLPRSETVQGTLVFCDVSGFTAETERLGRKGRVGSELMNELIVLSFSGMLDLAESLGGDLLIFGGDALFLLFEGDNHVERGLRTAVGMRQSLRSTAQARREVVRGSTLTVSTGVHTGDIWLGVVGDRFPLLFPSGSTVTRLLQLEALAQPGEIVVSDDVVAAAGGCAQFVAHPSEPAAQVVKRLAMPTADFIARQGTSDSSEFTPTGGEATLVDPMLATLASSADALEHRDAGVAFVHCKGVDNLSDSERLRAVSTFVNQVSTEAASQGVCIMSGDVGQDTVTLMLGAGLPRVQGEDADRLVGTLLGSVAPIDGVFLSAGAQAGPLLAGFVGSEGRRVYTGMGDVVNGAARITANAAPGEVLIGDGVADRLRSSWKMRVRAPFAAKGKQKLVNTRAVLARLVPKVSVTATLPFVGRERELSVIRRALSTADTWTEILGAPGAGKSRLLSEALSVTPGQRVLHCFADPTASDAPYQAISPALLQWISGDEDPSLVGDRRLDMLLDGLARAGDDLSASLVGAVRRVFGVDGRRTDPAVIDRRAVHRVVIEVLRQLSPSPMVLVIEDAQWFDASSAELVIALRSSVLDVRIVSTRRLDGEGLLAVDQGVDRIVLEAIESDDLGAAARTVASELGISRSVLGQLISRSDGNPLVLELLLDAQARGLSAETLPPRAEELAGRLLDSLLPVHRHLLGVAAVCGSGSDIALVSSVAGIAQHQVELQFEMLRELAEINAADGSVRFRHALVRDAAYARLPFRLRFELHAKVAETFERAQQDFDDTPILAYHFHRAGDHAKAWRYGREAGNKARSADAPVEAAAHFRRALENATFLDDLHFGDLIMSWEALGAAEQRNGNPGEAERAFVKAFELTHLLQAELYRERGRLAADTRRLAVATRWYEKARRSAEITKGRRTDQFLLGVQIDRAAIRYRQGKFNIAEKTLLDATKHARRLRDDRRLAHGLYLLALVSGELGRSAAVDYGEEAARLQEQNGDKLGLARTLNNLGVIHQLMGEWEDAVAYYRRSTIAYFAAGDNSGAAIIQNNVGEILSDQGNYSAAREEFASAKETWSESAFVIGVALASSNLGRLEARAAPSTGHERDATLMAAGELLAQASDAFVMIGGWDFVFETRMRVAELALRSGNPEEAELLLSSVPDTMTEAANLPGRAAQRARLRGIAATLQGNEARARELFEAALSSAEQAQNRYEQACAAQAVSELTNHLDSDVVEKFARLAQEWFDQLGVLADARRTY